MEVASITALFWIPAYARMTVMGLLGTSLPYQPTGAPAVSAAIAGVPFRASGNGQRPTFPSCADHHRPRERPAESVDRSPDAPITNDAITNDTMIGVLDDRGGSTR